VEEDGENDWTASIGVNHLTNGEVAYLTNGVDQSNSTGMEFYSEKQKLPSNTADSSDKLSWSKTLSTMFK